MWYDFLIWSNNLHLLKICTLKKHWKNSLNQIISDFPLQPTNILTNRNTPKPPDHLCHRFAIAMATTHNIPMATFAWEALTLKFLQKIKNSSFVYHFILFGLFLFSHLLFHLILRQFLHRYVLSTLRDVCWSLIPTPNYSFITYLSEHGCRAGLRQRVALLQMLL